MLVLDSAESESESITVLSESLTSDDADILPISGKIPIVRLAPGQKVKAECFARLGRGTEHAKWNSANVSILVDGESDDERILTIESTGGAQAGADPACRHRRGQPQAGRVSGHSKGARIIPTLGFDPTPLDVKALCMIRHTCSVRTPSCYCGACACHDPHIRICKCPLTPPSTHTCCPFRPREVPQSTACQFPGPCGGCAASDMPS